jgi:pectate lyase
VRGPLFAATAGAILLAQALAGCDVRIRPITFLPEAGAPSPDATVSVCPDDGVMGYASVAPGSGTYSTTIGGGSTTPVTVDASDSGAITLFKSYADRKSGAAVIQINGIISFAGFSDSQVRVASNTTIVGMDDHSGFTGGGLDLNGSSNIIIKNLVISKAVGTDAITIQGPDSTNIWIDHCDLSSVLHADGASYDGLVDITHAADLITISWTSFHDHKDTGIIGHSDTNGTQDMGFLHVTYSHDWFRNVDAGPRARFGNVHVLNVLFQQVTLYGVASTMSAHARVDNSYFESVTAPGGDANYGPVTTRLIDSPDPGYADLVTNYEDATDGNDVVPAAQTDMWDPSPLVYLYNAASPSDARAVVATCAGPRAVPGTILPSP